MIYSKTHSHLFRCPVIYSVDFVIYFAECTPQPRPALTMMVQPARFSFWLRADRDMERDLIFF